MSEEESTPIAKNEASEPLLNNNNNNAAKIRSKIVQAQQKRKKSPSNSRLLRSLGEKELKLRQRTVALLVREWHKEHNSCAPLTIKELYQKLYDRYDDVDDEQSVRQNTINDKYLRMTVELAGVGKILSYGFMLLKAEPLSNLPNLLHALLPPNPLYCVGRHRVFHGHGGKELTSADFGKSNPTADLLEKEFVQLISKFRAKNGKCANKKMLQKIEFSKRTADGPLQFMKKYIEKKGGYTKAIKMACLQWAQAYRQPQGTCGDVVTSGDVLVILPGQNSKCIVYTFYVSRAVQLGTQLVV